MIYELARGDFGLFEALIFVIAVIAAITIHEFAHAVRAYQAGDSTPKHQGRLTLNPAAHYDPVGTTMMLLMGMGWGRAVMTRPESFRHPRRDMLMVALWGPLSNVLLAVALLLIDRFIPIAWGPWPDLVKAMVQWNLILAFFNLIPVTPLDGSKILSNLLPIRQAMSYDRFMAQFGFFVLFALVFFAQPLVSLWVSAPYKFIASVVGGWQFY